MPWVQPGRLSAATVAAVAVANHGVCRTRLNGYQACTHPRDLVGFSPPGGGVREFTPLGLPSTTWRGQNPPIPQMISRSQSWPCLPKYCNCSNYTFWQSLARANKVMNGNMLRQPSLASRLRRSRGRRGYFFNGRHVRASQDAVCEPCGWSTFGEQDRVNSDERSSRSCTRSPCCGKGAIWTSQASTRGNRYGSRAWVVPGVPVLARLATGTVRGLLPARLPGARKN